MRAMIHDNPRELPGRGLASSRGTDWSAIGGLLVCVCWAPMAIVILRLPDLGSAAEIERFWRENLGLVQAVILSTSIGFIFLLVFLGGLAEELHRVDAGLAFAAFGSALMFMTALNIALGLDVASGLLSERGPTETTYALHSAAFLLAAPAAPVGATFFVTVAFAAFRRNVFSRPLAWLAVVGVLANIGALGGILTLTGPLNSGNGVIGGIAAPLGLYLAWILGVSISWLRNPSHRV
jgi:hypothetical protein